MTQPAGDGGAGSCGATLALVDGVHDLGGIEGFGAVAAQRDEPVFSFEWERRVFGLNFSALPAGVDRFRHAVERMGAVPYLTTSYYEHWLAAIEALALETGTVTAAELATARGSAAAGAIPPRVEDPARAAALVAAVTAPARPAPAGAPGRFGVGDPVRVQHTSPAGHTRCPRYVRGAPGVVEELRGRCRLPDAAAAGREEQAPLYGVRFRAVDLWGSGTHDVHLDLWEPYLEPRTAEATDG